MMLVLVAWHICTNPKAQKEWRRPTAAPFSMNEARTKAVEANMNFLQVDLEINDRDQIRQEELAYLQSTSQLKAAIAKHGRSSPPPETGL